MPANKGSFRPAVSQNRTCRTFTSLSDFRTSLTSRMALGESAHPHTSRVNGGGGLPLWRAELLRRPLRRVVTWARYTIPSEKKFRLPACEMYRETLECGHKCERMMSIDAPAKRRRCRECGRAA